MKASRERIAAVLLTFTLGVAYASPEVRGSKKQLCVFRSARDRALKYEHDIRQNINKTVSGRAMCDLPMPLEIRET